MHPYIAYTLVALIVVGVVAGIAKLRRSNPSRSHNRFFRHTFEDVDRRR